MNRKERRKNKIKTKDKVYNLKQSDIDKMKDEATREAIVKLIYISFMALRDEFGFGKKRICQFMDKSMDLLDSIEKDYLNFDDIVQAIYEETGYKILDEEKR